MDRFHIEGMAKDEGNAFPGAEVGDPVPGEHAFYGDHDVLTERSNDTEKSFWVCVDILMNPDIPSGIKDADKHILGMQVDSTIKLVLFGVEFHTGLPPFDGIWYSCNSKPTIFRGRP